MAGKSSRVLVIDASVAHASGGEDAMFPTSVRCRDFLKAVLRICHRMAMSPAVAEEWNKHQSHFARRWRVAMTSKKKIVYCEAGSNKNLRTRITQAAVGDKESAAMLKDIHLLEAAQATDRIVVSLDETVRKLFAQAARRIGELKSITWVNPDESEEKPIAWLEQKMRQDKSRQLGHTD
ncbi:MAG: hypothetical protein AAB354_14935 [candidate division KSB1 bacterium]